MEVALLIIPAGRVVMLLEMSTAVRVALQRAKPEVRIRLKREAREEASAHDRHALDMLEGCVLNMARYCRITGLELAVSPGRGVMIGDEGAGRLVALLRHCPSLDYLNLQFNEIGAEAAERLVAELLHYTSLAFLSLARNDLGSEGLGRLAGLLPQLPSLAHLDLEYTSLGEEGVGVAGCAAPALHIAYPSCGW